MLVEMPLGPNVLLVV
jgi:hypothetical protein